MKKIVIFLVLFSAVNLLAQESKKEQSSPEPLELPNFIIQGTLQLNVNSGVKQNPERPKTLTDAELDSLNSLEKQSSQSFPVEQLTLNTIERNVKDGFVKAQFGRFTTAQIDAGYEFDIANYGIYSQIGYEMSDGHLSNADFSKFNLKLSSDYIAPQKFFIFGGSRTRTQIDFNTNSYKLFANPTALNRTTNNFSAKVDVDGNYQGFKFETGAGFNGYQLITNDFKNADNNLFGYLKMHNIWNNFQVAGNLLIDLHTLRGQATNFIQLDASLSIFSQDISLTGGAGLQWATNSAGIDRGGLLIEGNLEYRLNKLLTLRADIRSGLENHKFRDLAYYNPYISNMAFFDYAYDIMNLSGNLIFHPNEVLGLSAGFRFRRTERFPIFKQDLLFYPGSFDLGYESISLFKSFFEAYWFISSEDKLTANITATESSLTDFDGKSVPYVPQLKLSADYHKTWFGNLGTNFGLDYIGKRFADFQNTVELDSYINLRIEGNYKIYDGLRAFLRFENLLNSDIYVWEGYRERNVFVSFGVMWQF
ncbi:hypothetical protein MASR1M45_11540 [Candidatus Kapaibacterium sp.]